MKFGYFIYLLPMGDQLMIYGLNLSSVTTVCCYLFSKLCHIIITRCTFSEDSRITFVTCADVVLT
jgi:hypothetical protein